MEFKIENIISHAEVDHLQTTASQLAEIIGEGKDIDGDPINVKFTVDESDVLPLINKIGSLTSETWEDAVVGLNMIIETQSDEGVMDFNEAEEAEQLLSELIAKVERMTGWNHFEG